MVSMFNLLCFRGFAAGQHVDCSFLFMYCNIYNRLVNVCRVKTFDWAFMSMFHFGKGVTVFGLLRFLSFYLFLCRATDCSTKRVEQIE